MESDLKTGFVYGISDWWEGTHEKTVDLSE